MNLHAIWQEAPEFRALIAGLHGAPGEQLVVGLQGSVRRFLGAGLLQAAECGALWLTPNAQSAERVYQDLQTLLAEHTVMLYPEREVLPFDVIAESHEQVAARLHVRERLLDGERVVVVSSIEAALGRLTPPDVVRRSMLRLRRGERLDLGQLPRRLVRLGYERVERIEAPGQFAIRGGIVDIWSLGEDSPWRVDLFDDEIDTLKTFAPDTQRSLADVERALVGPARELVLTEDAAAAGLQAMKREMAQQIARLRRAERLDLAQRLQDRVGHVLDTWGDFPSGASADRFHAFFYPRPATLADYLPDASLVFVEDPERMWESARAAERLAQDRSLALLGEGSILPGQGDVMAAHGPFEERLQRHRRFSFTVLPRRLNRDKLLRVVSVAARPVENFHGQWPLFCKELARHRESGHRIVVLASTDERHERLVAEIEREEVPVRRAGSIDRLKPREVLVAKGKLEGGFHLPELHLWLLTDAEIFGREKRRTHRASAASEVPQDNLKRVQNLSELQAGDFVVHVHHGIGRYLGLRTMTIEGVQKDYLHVEYAHDDRLYVPIDQIDLVQKYIGQEGREPKIHRLGSGDWSRVKARVKQSVREMAQELLRLYAMRKATPGIAFSQDGEWQRQLEDAFAYEETPDQRRAIAELKRDMESSIVMDRLLCGDVGYGKTEVAIRAAFKAAMDGRQTAVLVPTTILAQQHYMTFKQRYEGFAVEVDLISRFRSPKEQQQTLKRLREGLTDVIIGTHRLLGKDVRFANLGLLIVDEEQRFGVRHKERLKQLKANIDTLTLTATPIPRTLHMGLVGLRDMSTIETPPEDRFPVQTYVVEWDEELVQDAVRRELGRGGQVFYVHNRVHSIEVAHALLQKTVPEARIAVAHGQMPEHVLERTMQAFLDGEFDILLATTIIESGLDMPRVNTLIVEDADRLGLSQLYQLRGRIGRSNRLAYAYLTYRRDRQISEVSEKRLQAVREFTEFGAGFKIAMRDLEIRGAGNILGPEQHGFIVAVGFELYTQLLDEAVREQRGEVVAERHLPSIDLPVDAYIPADYVGDVRQKIELYKRIAALTDIDDAEDLLDEVEDRFGRPPQSVTNLFRVARIRIRGEELGVQAIRRERGQITLNFQTLNRVAREKLREFPAHYRGKASLYAGASPYLALRAAGTVGEETLQAIEEMLGFLSPEVESA